MDPNGNIYPIDPAEAEKQSEALQEIFREDAARFDGYMRARTEESPDAREAKQAAAREKLLEELEARAKARSAGQGSSDER